MNVTLVYPSIRYFGWNSLGKHAEGCYVNHGVASIVTCLEQRGHSVKLLDLREIHDWKETVDWIAHDQSMMYGISMSTLDYHEAVEVATIIRRVKPKATIVVGGPHASICPDEVSAEVVFDYIVIGEGEVTFPKIVDNPDSYPRIVKAERPDLNKLPYEKREIFNMQKVLSTPHPFFKQPFLTVISGRGCIFNCSFCKPGEDLIFGKFRMRSLDHFFGEIRMLNDRYNFKMLMIDDDSFTLYPQYVLDFCDRYESIKKPWICQSRADFIVKHPDIMRRMKAIGLDMVFIGLESGNQRILDLMQKGTTVEQNYEAVRLCHRLGIKVFGNFMFGLPTETKEEMQDTFNMIKTLKPEHPSGAVFTPIQGTYLYDYCKEHNLIISEDTAILGTRSATGTGKIKGIDYKWAYSHRPNARIYSIRHALRPLKPLRNLIRKMRSL